MTQDLEALPGGGTRVSTRVAKPRPKDREVWTDFFPMVEPFFVQAQDGIIAALDEELARRAAMVAGTDVAPEPELPAGEGRFLREPVRPGSA